MSEQLNITTWLWGDRYSDEYAVKLFSSIDRNLQQPYRKICITDRKRSLPDEIEQFPIPNPELVDAKIFKGCCARLRTFDVSWQQSLGLVGRIVTFDLDCVVISELDSLFDRPQHFTIMQEVNVSAHAPFSGGLQMLRSGCRPDVWTLWDAARKGGEIEWSDERWLSKMVPNAAGWTGRKDGVWSMHKMYWPGGLDSYELPDNSKIVFFTGKLRKPMTQFSNLQWFRENWR